MWVHSVFTTSILIVKVAKSPKGGLSSVEKKKKTKADKGGKYSNVPPPDEKPLKKSEL